jgi:glycosyltransferase involved in cell wall biosynthesis
MGLLMSELIRRRRQIDVVHVHQLFHAACAAVAAQPLHGRPVLVKLATAGPYGDLHQMRTGQTVLPGSRHLLPLALQANRIVAISEEISKELLEAGVPPARIARIPNGVALPQRPPGRAEREASRHGLGLARSDEVVVYVGRCFPQKAPDLLLGAWEVLRQRPRCHLLLLGEGFLEDARFLGAASESPRFRVQGRVHDVQRYLRAADVLLHPSRGEGLSNSLLEALAMGVPCVASGIAANVELLACGAGLLAPPESGAELGRLAAQLLDDEKERRRLGERGRRRAQDFDLCRVAQRYEELYKQMMEESHVGSEPLEHALQR